MKNKNLNIILELAVALVFLCAPVRADNFSAVASRSDKTAKVSESNIMMESFGNYVNPLLRHIQGSYVRKNNLKNTKDILLQKLISGEVDVSEIDIVMREQVNVA